jgi:hypothetical protein
LAAAKAFYVDGLGFRVTFEASPNGHSGLLGLERLVHPEIDPVGGG